MDMAGEVQELKEAVASLTKKVDGLSGLANRVDELSSGMNIIREVVLRLDAASNTKQKNGAESHIPEAGEHHAENDSASVGEAEREIGKYRKLELPVFEGEDPLGWFYRVERYFRINAIAENERLDAAVVCLEGKALNWYQWKETREPISSWSEFKRELLRRFHSSQRGGEYRILFAAKQESSILEYVEEFERLSAPLKDASEECLIGAFLNGLKLEVQAELKLANVKTLCEFMEKAICVDEKNQMLDNKKDFRVTKTLRSVNGLKSNSAQPFFSRVTHTPEPNRGVVSVNAHADNTKRAESKAVDAKTGSSVTVLSSASKGWASSRLSDAEIARRRELGLCFKCAEKFGPNHVCKNKHLQMILLEMDTKDDPGGNEINGSEEASLEA